MAKRRIATKPVDLIHQLNQASAGIGWTGGGPNWPMGAPTQPEVNAAATTLNNSLTQVETAEGHLKALRAALHAQTDAGIEIMRRIDEVTDGLYGADGPEKANFGLDPKKTTHGEKSLLGPVVITKIADGTTPASLFVDWETDEGAAAYQIEWYTDSALTARVGNAAVSTSECTIPGLHAGQQYWVRVRSVLGEDAGPWSDPATRIANL